MGVVTGTSNFEMYKNVFRRQGISTKFYQMVYQSFLSSATFKIRQFFTDFLLITSVFSL